MLPVPRDVAPRVIPAFRNHPSSLTFEDGAGEVRPDGCADRDCLFTPTCVDHHVFTTAASTSTLSQQKDSMTANDRECAGLVSQLKQQAK